MRGFAAVAVVLVATAVLAQSDPRPLGVTTQRVWIEDMKHHLSLVAGDNYDNNVYH